jgi:O-methyltransferase domain/Dimerisation domain
VREPGSFGPVDSDAGLGGRLRDMIDGYRVSQVISAAVTLDLPDLLAAGPRPAADLALATETDARSLYRLLRTLAALGILAERPDGTEPTFALTEQGRLLCRDVPGSLAGWAAFVTRPYHWAAWGDLVQSVRTGEGAFDAQHDESVWAWRARDPVESEVFNQAMSAIAATASARLVEAYDFARFASLADIGGGDGTLLATLLARYPDLHGVLFDLPHVVSGGRSRLPAAGVADRCRVVPGSFFDEVPSGCDAYLMKSILHDWDDASAVRILRRLREAAGPGTVLLIVERVVGDPVPSPAVGLSDLNMMVMTGGMERTVDEWRELARAGGFALGPTVEIGLGWHVLEAEPA